MEEVRVRKLQPLYFLAFLIKKYWKGNGSLVVAFWGILIIGNLLIYILALLAATMGKIEISIALLLLHFPWQIYALGCVWACSKNTKRKIWGDAAKLFVILNLALFLGGILKEII